MSNYVYIYSKSFKLNVFKNMYFNTLKAKERIIMNCRQMKPLKIHSLHFKPTLIKSAMIFYKFNICVRAKNSNIASTTMVVHSQL